LLLGFYIVVQVQYGCAHALVDDVGAADVQAPGPVFEVELFLEGDFDLGRCTRDDGAE
jgi:hypothetical protein